MAASQTCIVRQPTTVTLHIFSDICLRCHSETWHDIRDFIGNDLTSESITLSASGPKILMPLPGSNCTTVWFWCYPHFISEYVSILEKYCGSWHEQRRQLHLINSWNLSVKEPHMDMVRLRAFWMSFQHTLLGYSWVGMGDNHWLFFELAIFALSLNGLTTLGEDPSTNVKIFVSKIIFEHHHQNIWKKSCRF